QVKVTERYIRRLEFHLSKIEELYEAYCLQRRLRDGANKMVKAYTTSVSSKEAKESLAEANKGYKEYTENMCMLENDLENHLGEFHIKMKGLAGFARLCAGDQYEVSLYGRQRWKLRGRIELNGRQVWDSEDMVFLPLVSDFLSVKVTELKSLANHVVVGSVSCETKDLFAALPQTVAVDINDLGTIKLSLEVTWNPFDKDDMGSVASTVTKAPTISKRLSTIFNQSPPDTPSLREQAFYSLPRSLSRRQHWPLMDIFRDTLSHSCPCNDISPTGPSANMLRRHEDMENGTAWSNSSESSDDSSSPRLSVGGLRNSTHHKFNPTVVVTPDIQPAVGGTSSPQPDISFCPRDSSSTPNSTHKISPVSEDPHTSARPEPSSREEESVNVTTKADSEKEDSGKRSPIATDDGGVTNSHPPRSYFRSLSHISESSADGIVLTDRAVQSGGGVSPTSGISITDIEMEVQSRTPPTDENTTADNATDQQDTHSSEPVDSETHTQPDIRPESGDVTYVARWVSVEEETPRAESPSRGSGVRGQFPELQLLEQELKLLQVTLKVGRSLEMLPQGGGSLQDRGWDSPPSPLTTGCTTLDCALVVHLNKCSTQLLCLGMFGPLRCGEMYALDRLLREAQVLKTIRRIAKDNPRRFRQPAEVIPQLGLCLGAELLWQQCVGQGSVYSVSAESFLLTLSAVYSRTLPERASSMADTVERVLDQRLPRRGNRDGVMVTLFQLWMWLVQSLASCDQEVIVQALRRPPECSLRREGLHAVAKLLRDPRGKVSASASSALVSCLELLEDEQSDTRVCGCKALACLKAKESIDQLVYLCRTDKDDVRDAAKQALLVLGEEGKMAHRHVETSQDNIPRLFAPGSMASTAF
ncbi:Rho family-interacting cell polarization regulator 1, partial [Dissostichus eleginoides]